MKTVSGNIFDLAERGEFDVVIHGCNCFNNFGKGIALEVKQRYPWVWEEDELTEKGSRDKLGTYTHGVVTMIGEDEEEDSQFTVINAYTQFAISRGQDVVNYGALEEVFGRVAKDFPGCRVAYPKIGAGLARGNWDRISRIISTTLSGFDHTLVTLEEISND